ncbi:hypothetical protein [Endozoicomonas sp.]|uniref:hypothetical protein n=1 Tax=Endozoicomonas sp. TaxID=1892382 RepID=UPI002885639E|nr:hypothetical protein [Endozoicomonas sp.]
MDRYLSHYWHRSPVESLSKQPSPEDVPQNARLSSSANLRVETCSGVAQLKVGSEGHMSSSAPERSLCDYKSRLLSVVAMPSHMATPIGKIIQVERIIGSDFFRIHNNAYAGYSRIPVLENLFSEAKRGERIVSVSELIKDREKYINDKIGNKEEYQKEAGQLIYLYLHFLLLFHDCGTANIKDFAPYLDVKNVLVTNWVYLIKPKLLAEASFELCKKELGQDLRSETDDSCVQFEVATRNLEEESTTNFFLPSETVGESSKPAVSPPKNEKFRFDPDKEKILLEGFAVKMEDLKRSHKKELKSNHKKELKSNHKKKVENNQKGRPTFAHPTIGLPGHLRIDTAFTYQNLVNMLLDFLALNSGKKSRIVMESVPELVVRFLNRIFVERVSVSENSSSKSRESLEETGAG